MKRLNFKLTDTYIIENKEDITSLKDIVRKTIKDNKITYFGIDIETSPIDKTLDGGALIHTNAIVRLIQLFCLDWECPYIIDTYKISKDIIIELLELLENLHHERIKLIGHNSMYEYIILRKVYDIEFSNINDTYTALGSLYVSQGWKEGIKNGLSLADMARSLFDINLDKTQQKSDWSPEVLSDEQLEYSILDVGAPRGYLNPFTNKPLKSILIEGYIVIEDICCNLIKEKWAFELDQKCVSVMADMKFNGWPINNPLKEILLETIKKKKRESLLDLCKGLNVSVKYDPFEDEYVIPSQVITTFNNPIGMVKMINKNLKKIDPNLYITNSESKVLLEVLKEIQDLYEKKEEIEDLYEHNNNEVNIKDKSEEKENSLYIQKQYTKNIEEKIKLIKSLINYKKFTKLNEFINKYINMVDNKTNRLHLTILPVGTSTGRGASKDERTKINAQNIPNSIIEIEASAEEIMGRENKNSKRYKINVSPRNLFTSSEGVFGSFDYSSQELVIVAYLSSETEMIQSFREKRDNPYIYNPETKEKVVNPDSDLHIKAAKFIFPSLKEIPLYKLNKFARTPDSNGVVPRHHGKIVNFSIIYGKTDRSFAQDFNITVEEAKDRIDNYLKGFPNLNKWLKTNHERGKVEKIVTIPSGRRISIWERNAKGVHNAESTGRKAVNAIVQGSAADMTKLACLYIKKRVKDIKSLSVVHDEYNCEIPGTCKLIDIKVDNGYMKPIFEVSNESKEIADEIVKCMEDAERDIIEMMGVNRDEIIVGVSRELAPYWKH